MVTNSGEFQARKDIRETDPEDFELEDRQLLVLLSVGGVLRGYAEARHEVISDGQLAAEGLAKVIPFPGQHNR